MSPELPSVEDGTFCSSQWSHVWEYYNQWVHHPFLLSICIFGCVANVLNLFVFTRSQMQNPSNLLLAVLAATDFFCVFRKAVDVSLKYYRLGRDERTSYHLHMEDWINEICFYLFHTWSIYMTLVVALWRLFGILRPIQSRYWQSYKNAISLAAIFLGFATLLVPMCFVGSSIQLYNPSGQQIYDSRTNSSSTELLPQEDEEYFEVDYDYDPDYVVTQTPFGESLQFWIHGLMIKLIPCAILVVSTVLLIASLKILTKKRLALFGVNAGPLERSSSNNENYDRTRNHIPDENDVKHFTEHTAPADTCPTGTKDRKEKKTNGSCAATKQFIRTTKMLIILLILFLVTEIPPGVLAFSHGLIKKRAFFVQCYLPIRGFLNLNEYISSSLGFFVYITMCSKFRQMFVLHFCKSNRPYCVKPTRLNIIMSVRSCQFRLFPSKNVGKSPDSSTTTAEMEDGL